jgi:hypothetical protein
MEIEQREMKDRKEEEEREKRYIERKRDIKT